jgi:peptidoglycan/LPS O-acetylase OafA/YrhL
MSQRMGFASRSSAIDIVKGLAIVSVICLHTLSTSTLHQIGALFHIWQAVPVFVFVMGLNGASSLRRRGRHSLSELYSREYLASRFDRVFVPFLLAFIGTVLVEALMHTEHRGPATLLADLLTGELPIGGPGNYFITLTFQFVLVFPLVYWGLRRWRLATVLLCLAISATFELLAPHVGFLDSDPYLYEACLARYLFVIALGGALSGIPARRLLGSWWLWCGALISTAYLMLAQIDPSAIPFGVKGWENSDFAAAFYPALLVLLGMVALPSLAAAALARGTAELGRASYHIFLLQIIWFGLAVWGVHSWQALPRNLAVTLIAGLAFYRAMSVMPLPSATRFVARRQTTLARAP